MPPPWLSSRSSPVIPVSLQGLEFSSQCLSGQWVMPISSMKPIQLDGINSLLLFPLRIPFFQKLVVERGKAQIGSTSICIGSVCVCRQGKEAERPLAFPVLKQTVPSYDLFGRSILRFIILSLSKWLIHLEGREEETCYADKTTH